jgi:hypothetical protein
MRRRRYSVSPWEVATDTSLSVNARHLYTIVLGLKPEPDGTALATYGQLAELMGASESTVKRAVRELGDASVLAWTSGRRRREPNRYEPLEVIPGSRPRSGPQLLPGGTSPVEVEQFARRAAGAVAGEELAVAAKEPPEPHHEIGVLAAVDVERPPEIGPGATRDATHADARGTGSRVRIARHDAERTANGGRR